MKCILYSFHQFKLEKTIRLLRQIWMYHLEEQTNTHTNNIQLCIINLAFLRLTHLHYKYKQKHTQTIRNNTFSTNSCIRSKRIVYICNLKVYKPIHTISNTNTSTPRWKGPSHNLDGTSNTHTHTQTYFPYYIVEIIIYKAYCNFVGM